MESQQGVVLQLRGLGEVLKPSHRKKYQVNHQKKYDVTNQEVWWGKGSRVKSWKL
jgi:hypothetical protein